MSTLTTIRFSREKTIYEVDIDYDENAIIEELIAFDVIARVTDNEGISYSETLRVEINLNELSGRILLGDRELHKFSFGDVNVRMDGQTGDETISGIDGDGELADNVYDNIQDGVGEAVGEIINAMPIPDPFFGCLIKASISSIVGQVITCNELRGNYGTGKIYRQILRCLGKHVKGIAFRTLWRAARCMIRLGF
jgi:hypothetical protein